MMCVTNSDQISSPRAQILLTHGLGAGRSWILKPLARSKKLLTK